MSTSPSRVLGEDILEVGDLCPDGPNSGGVDVVSLDEIFGTGPDIDLDGALLSEGKATWPLGLTMSCAVVELDCELKESEVFDLDAVPGF